MAGHGRRGRGAGGDGARRTGGGRGAGALADPLRLDPRRLCTQVPTTHYQHYPLLLRCRADSSFLFSCGWWWCSEEVVERAVSLARDLVVDNGLMPGMGAGKSRYAL